jgi:hypothetical protein
MMAGMAARQARPGSEGAIRPRLGPLRIPAASHQAQLLRLHKSLAAVAIRPFLLQEAELPIAAAYFSICKLADNLLRLLPVLG